MKKFAVLTCLMILLFSVNTAHAQQAKAYETIKYTAKYKRMAFNLIYADGYIGASKIKLTQPLHKPLLFEPESGVPDADATFVLRLNSGNKKAEIRLADINEEAEAPGTIKAVYYTNAQHIPLLFKRSR